MDQDNFVLEYDDPGEEVIRHRLVMSNGELSITTDGIDCSLEKEACPEFYALAILYARATEVIR